MIIAQNYSLIVLKVDVNNILKAVESGDISVAAQHPWDSKSFMQKT